jgi:hypothetical protein
VEAVVADAEVPSTVEVRGQTVQFAPPASVAIRYEVAYAAAENESRAFAAALGVCWPKLGKRVRYRYDVMAYGGQVIEFLLEEGWSYMDIQSAGVVAYAHIAQTLPRASEVKEAEDFSEAAPAE